MCSLAWLPAGVSLTTAGVDALGQGLMQSGINHVQTDWFLMHLAAGIPVRNIHEVKTQQGAGTVHYFGQKLFGGWQPPHPDHPLKRKYSEIDLKRKSEHEPSKGMSSARQFMQSTS